MCAVFVSDAGKPQDPKDILREPVFVLSFDWFIRIVYSSGAVNEDLSSLSALILF